MLRSISSRLLSALVPAKAGTQSEGKKELDSRLRGNERIDRSIRGFTLIEVLVALSVVAVTLTAIGSLIGVTVRGARSIPSRLALVETARAVMAGLPDRDALAPGTLTGELASHRWRLDVLPFFAEFIDPQQPTLWIPQTVVVRVQSPSGRIIQVNTVRIRRKADQ